MGRERIETLQILRFVAAGMVIIYHLTYLGQKLTGVDPSLTWIRASSVGAAGVDVFFVISGYIIVRTGPLATPAPDGESFAWRRWSRVAPVYFLISLPLVVSAAVHEGLSPGRLATSFLFWPSRTTLPYLDQGWTLCFEMMFYLAVSLLLAMGGDLPRRLAVCGIVLAGMAVIGWLNPIYLEFGAGALIAGLNDHIRRLGRLWGGVLITMGLAVFATEMILGVRAAGDPMTVLRGDDWARLAIFGLPAAAIVAGALVLERPTNDGPLRLISRAGDASYSIYLCHTFAISLIATVWSFMRLPTFGVEIIAFASAVVMGLAAYRLIERPIVSDLKRISAQWFISASRRPQIPD